MHRGMGVTPLMPMAERQKRLEELTDTGEWWEVGEDGRKVVGVVPAHLPFLIRVDGHKFSTLCRNGRFTTPYDVRIHNAMVCAARDTLSTFSAVAAYTFSDEISLLFPPVPALAGRVAQKHPHKGRVAKLTTLAASFVSARFNFHLARQHFADHEEKTKSVAQQQRSYFDARAVIMPSREEFFEYLQWRQADCLRNSKGHMGYAFLDTNVYKVSANEIIRRVLRKHGVNWHKMPFWYKEGMLMKKQQFTKTATNGLTGQPLTATRARVVACNGLLADYSDENVVAVAAKYVEDPTALVHMDSTTGGTLGTVTTGQSVAADAPVVVVEEDYDFFSLAKKQAFPPPLAVPNR